SMFLRANKRYKDGKEHRYWSVVENRRLTGGRSVQKTLLYLGEINDSERVPGPALSRSSMKAIKTVKFIFFRRIAHRILCSNIPRPNLGFVTK
ncbi:MAG: hypothetical protein ACK5LK_06910, partial [Chthoniobacterales bacterium]